MKKFNFAFWGTPDVASRTLDILFKSGYIPSIIITSPDARSGRGLHMHPTPVCTWATEHNIPCLKPEKISDDLINELKKFDINLSIVVAYGKILPENLIKMPDLGTINIHYSLLPLYRGASPLEQALLNGDAVTGVTVQQMEFKLDSGAVIAREEINIGINENKDSLRSKLITLGGETLVKLIPDIIEDKIDPISQDENLATYCTKIKKDDGQIDPHGDGKLNYNKYRAFSGWPGIFFFVNNKRVKVTSARYENDSFIIERVVPEGKKEIEYSAFSTLK